MNIKEIEEQLKNRVAQKVKVTTPTSRTNAKGQEAFKQMKKRLEGIPDWLTEVSYVIEGELNGILTERGISFSTEDEKNSFIADIRPTLLELVAQYTKV